MICIVETSFNSELDENIMASKHKRTFRKPKNAEEEKQLLENAVPKSTRSVNNWAMKIFFLFILFHFFFQAFDLFQKRVGLMVIYLITILYIKCYPH